jgi:hypothetical protein
MNAKLIQSTLVGLTMVGTLVNIRLSLHKGYASLTVSHGPSQPESTIAVTVEMAQNMVLGQSIVLEVR